MSEFLHLLSPLDAQEYFFSHLHPLDGYELIQTEQALDRITAGKTKASFSLPSFPRSTVDGYALRASDSFGASDRLPAYLRLQGEVRMGMGTDIVLDPAACALIHTGGMLPEGANAVVMVEYTQQSHEAEVEVRRAVAVGENVLQVGEDVSEGEEVIPKGVRLRPAEIGGLMALGIDQIAVTRRPKVGIISSGDEVVPPGQPLQPGQVFDVNSYTLSSLMVSAGAEARPYGIIPDEEDALSRVAAQALQECDLVVLTAGSSVSVRDLTAEVIDSLGRPGVLVHGVNIRPGKPTILGLCDGKPVIGLPGNPVSALVIATLFVVPIVEVLMGVERKQPRPSISATLALNLASTAGREDWVPVRLNRVEAGYKADPVFGKSNLIFTLARADGLVRIPPNVNGISAGEEVVVWLM